MHLGVSRLLEPFSDYLCIQAMESIGPIIASLITPEKRMFLN